MKLLLHCCCAPCTVQCAEELAHEGLRPRLFWFNPNIHPYTEYRTRRDTLFAYAADQGLESAGVDEYGLRAFIDTVYGEKLRGASRCAFCYRLRLEKTACYAAENGFDHFSTTLLISPYQDHEALRRAGEELAQRYGLGFLYRDFRPRFREGQAKARELGLYMQKYCGCIFSEEERYVKTAAHARETGASVS
jgi:predicted adenine nucleotide alpha hydrolase (AANH) superfamily ATPase